MNSIETRLQEVELEFKRLEILRLLSKNDLGVETRVVTGGEILERSQENLDNILRDIDQYQHRLNRLKKSLTRLRKTILSPQKS